MTLTTSGCAGLRWAKTSTSTVTQVCPTSTMAAWKLTRSPTETGCLKTKESTDTVATLDLAWRIAGTAAATSTIDMIQPPNTSPDGLRAAGIGITCSTTSLSVGNWQATAACPAGASAGIARLLPPSPTAT